jgi:phage-related protein
MAHVSEQFNLENKVAIITGSSKGIGKAIGAILRGFASGVMAFANPFVIAGLAVFTLGMIGLGAALRIAAPAFEAIAPIITRVAEIIGVTLMTAIKEIPAIFESIGNVIEKVGGVIIGIVEAVGGAVGGVVTSIAEGIATVVNATTAASSHRRVVAATEATAALCDTVIVFPAIPNAAVTSLSLSKVKATP